jgi:hypothetical protein
VVYSRAAGLARLALDASANRQEINQRFRELAREAHPDTGGEGDLEDLLAARDAALGGAPDEPTRDLDLVRSSSPVAVAQELRSLRRDIQRWRTESRSASEAERETPFGEAVAGITATLSSRYRDAQRRAASAAALSIGASAAAAFAVPGPFVVLTIVTGACGVVGFFQGLRVLVIRTTRNRIRYAMEDATEAMTDVPTYVSLLTELTEWARGQYERSGRVDAYWLRTLPPWTRRDIEATLDMWMRTTTIGSSAPSIEASIATTCRMILRDFVSVRVPHGRTRIPLVLIARTIETHDFARLVIEAGLELDLIREVRTWEGVPGVVYEPSFDLLRRDEIVAPSEAG